MKFISFSGGVFLGLALASWLAVAQTGAPAPAPEGSPVPAAPSPAAVAAPPPVVGPANELKGAALVEALRKGGFVLYMRHTETGVVTEKCEASNLSVIGEENARIVGAALRELKIPVGVVRSSQPCRCADTARLLGHGAVEITEDLNPVAPREGFDIGAARAKRLAEKPAAGTNTVLVSHLHGSRNKEEWLHLQMGEIIVFRPDAQPRAEPIARIPVGGWNALKSANSGEVVPR